MCFMQKAVAFVSKQQTVLANRVAWAKTYLKKAGLVDSPQYGFVMLTEAGKAVFADDPDKVTISYLETIPSFHEFHTMANMNSTTVTIAPSKAETSETKSPQEMLDEAMEQMNATLADDLMTEIMKLDWSEFEQLVLGETNYKHMETSHPDAFGKYFCYLEDILASPDYVNRNPRDGSIKYIKRINEYVVVGVRVSTRGTAFARTIFTFTDEKFDQYKRSGYLKAHT